MTLKYESEILFDLMKRDGDDNPSSVLPYESELKEKYLNQVVGAYPKLQDYRPEWLYYNLYQHLPSDFPVESVANVTSASFNNVVPYAYKSAILKGCTLVNVFSNASVNYERNATHTGNKTINLTSTGAVCHSWWNVDLQTTKQYMLSINIIENTSTGNLIIKTGDEKTLKIFDVGVTGKQNIIFTPTNGGIRFKHESLNTGTTVIDEIMLIEYQDGMENWDIQYFEGMQSVKMPVLTTVGKNLFNIKDNTHVLTKLENGNYNVSVGIYLNLPKFKEKTSYTLSFSVSEKHGVTYQFPRIIYSDNTELISYRPNGTFNGNPAYILKSDSTKTISHIDFSYGNNDVYLEFVDFQIEEGSNSTSYEPYKTNILTVNEDVTLRGIGDVKDTLDCLTGEVTERIGEIVLDGNEDWETDINGSGVRRYFLQGAGSDLSDNTSNSSTLLCDKFNATSNAWVETNNGVQIIKSSGIFFIDNSVDSLELFVNKVKTTNIKVQYKLETESIKTVDLSCINEQGKSATFRPIEGTMHVNTSSQTLPPLLDMSVPVEATTQNLMSFANIEEEE